MEGSRNSSDRKELLRRYHVAIMNHGAAVRQMIQQTRTASSEEYEGLKRIAESAREECERLRIELDSTQ